MRYKEKYKYLLSELVCGGFVLQTSMCSLGTFEQFPITDKRKNNHSRNVQCVSRVFTARYDMIYFKRRRIHLALFLAAITITYLLFSSNLPGIFNNCIFKKVLSSSSTNKSPGTLSKSDLTKKSQSIVNRRDSTKDRPSSSVNNSSNILNKSHFTRDPTLPYALTFGDSKHLPFFYKPLSRHPNDIFKEKNSIGKYITLKQDLTTSKRILFFNIPSWIKPYYMPFCNVGIEKCPVKSCECSDNPKHFSTADAILIDGVELQQPVPPVKLRNQVWIFYGIEPPSQYISTTTFNSNWSRMFNWTMTYRLDSDVVAPYDVLIHRNARTQKNFTEIALAKSKSAFWMVSDCQTQSKREEYVQRLKEYYPVDIYGRCGPEKRRFNGAFETLAKDYRFYLSFENALCDDYVTEKLFRFYTEDLHVVPVVRGRVKYSSLFPQDTFINTADYSSPRKLAEYLKSLERNITAYAEMISGKENYMRTMNLGKLASPFCDVCIKLHNLDIFSNHYSNVFKWLEEGICHPPDDY